MLISTTFISEINPLLILSKEPFPMDEKVEKIEEISKDTKVERGNWCKMPVILCCQLPPEFTRRT